LDVIITSYHEIWNSRKKYCKVLDATSYIIIQTDPNGKIIFTNKVVSFLGFDVFDLIGKDFKNLCLKTLSDTSRAPISIRRVCPRGTTDQKISLRVNKQSTLYDICRSMNFVMTGAGIWNVPQEYVMKKERLVKSSDISYGVPKLRLRTLTGTYQNFLNSGLNQCVQVCAGLQK
jgi:hypothetical protein